MWGLIVLLSVGLFNLFQNPNRTETQNNTIAFSKFSIASYVNPILANAFPLFDNAFMLFGSILYLSISDWRKQISPNEQIRIKSKNTLKSFLFQVKI